MRSFVKPWENWSRVDKIVLWIACMTVAAIAVALGQHITWDWSAFFPS